MEPNKQAKLAIWLGSLSWLCYFLFQLFVDPANGGADVANKAELVFFTFLLLLCLACFPVSLFAVYFSIRSFVKQRKFFLFVISLLINASYAVVSFFFAIQVFIEGFRGV